MKSKHTTVRLASLFLLLALGGWNCKSEDGCKAAKEHMCSKIYGMNCYAAFMDNAQQKIIAACGQAELDAYIPVVQAACMSQGTAMNCGEIAGKTYAGPSSDAGGTCDAGAPMKFSYSGTATADSRSAELEFTVAGTAITGGRLTASPVCAPSVHLNRTDVSFTGTLSGTWESASGVITASWTGGDYACDGTLLTPADGYPTSGSLTIRMAGNVVSLQRIISKAEPYQFSPTNQTYTPAAATCGPAPTVDSGTRDGSAHDVNPPDSPRDLGPPDSPSDLSPPDSSSDTGTYDSRASDSASDVSVSVAPDSSTRDQSPLDTGLRDLSLLDSGTRDVNSFDSRGADVSIDALGPVCAKLAVCCPTITDIPALQQQCVITLSNGLGDPGCQITWDTLVRLGYCAGIAAP